MCLCILVHQQLENYPLIIAANREEEYARPSRPPAWLPGGTFAGSDQCQGGTWQGVNQHGLVVALTNRSTSLQDPQRRSRGLLCLEALSAASAQQAVDWISQHFSYQAYNPCNLLLADVEEAFAVHYDGDQAKIHILSPGLHLLSDTDVDDSLHPRIQRARKLLGDTRHPWPALQIALGKIMADHDSPHNPTAPICIHGAKAGTRSSSLIALRDRSLNEAQFYFADGPPCTTPYLDLSTQLSHQT